MRWKGIIVAVVAIGTIGVTACHEVSGLYWAGFDSGTIWRIAK